MARPDYELLQDEDGKRFWVLDSKEDEILSGPHPSNFDAHCALTDKLVEYYEDSVNTAWTYVHRAEADRVVTVNLFLEMADASDDERAAHIAEKLRDDHDRGLDWLEQALDYLSGDQDDPPMHKPEEDEETAEC